MSGFEYIQIPDLHTRVNKQLAQCFIAAVKSAKIAAYESQDFKIITAADLLYSLCKASKHKVYFHIPLRVDSSSDFWNRRRMCHYLLQKNHTRSVQV